MSNILLDASKDFYESVDDFYKSAQDFRMSAREFESIGWIGWIGFGFRIGAKGFEQGARNFRNQAKFYQNLAYKMENEGARVFTGCVKEYEGDEYGMKKCFRDRFGEFEMEYLDGKKVVISDRPGFRMRDFYIF